MSENFSLVFPMPLGLFSNMFTLCVWVYIFSLPILEEQMRKQDLWLLIGDRPGQVLGSPCRDRALFLYRSWLWQLALHFVLLEHPSERVKKLLIDNSQVQLCVSSLVKQTAACKIKLVFRLTDSTEKPIKNHLHHLQQAFTVLYLIKHLGKMLPMLGWRTQQVKCLSPVWDRGLSHSWSFN